MDIEARLTEVELQLMRQDALVEELNRQLAAANQTIERLHERVRQLEGQTEVLAREVFPPANEKPPHY